ncbi:LysR family transcriptional regulator [Pedococcus aerophilus]|uniref:LysR family transcriptional regulator n=1 Tax=Pedococcus aerophilus TaxID=436356 RepID=UPI0031D90302
MPELDGLRLLVGIAQHASIGGTARANGISQQAASERLRAMEAQTGLTLVHRGARGSKLTPAGVVVAEWAARLIEVADEIDTAIEGLRGDRSRELSVWASMTIAESLIPRWLVLLRQRQQGEGHLPTAVSLNASNSSHVVEAVRDGTAHLGFVEGVEAPRGVRCASIGHDELVLVAAAGTPISRRRTPLSPAEVAELPLTSRERGSGTREVLEVALGQQGLTMGDAVVELTTATSIREAVLAGSSPAFLSHRFVSRDLDSGHLVVVPTENLDLKRVFRAVWVGTRQPPAGPGRELVSIARAAEQRLGHQRTGAK